MGHLRWLVAPRSKRWRLRDRDVAVAGCSRAISHAGEAVVVRIICETSQSGAATVHRESAFNLRAENFAISAVQVPQESDGKFLTINLST